MAFGMKHWIGLVAAGLALVALLALPPRAMDSRAELTPTHEEVRARALRTEFRQGWDVLKRMRWADSLASLAVRTAEDGVAVGAPEGTLTSEELATLHANLMEELDEVGPLREGVVLGFFAHPVNFATSPDAPRDTRTFEEVYVGRLDGVEYCVRVEAINRHEITGRFLAGSRWDRIEQDGREYSDMLELCRLVARHGLPGEEIMAWLENGAAGFAEDPAETPFRGRMNENWLRDANLPFGFRARLRSSGSQALTMERCHTGTAEACGEVAAAPEITWPATVDAIEVARRSPALTLGRYNGTPFGSPGDYLISDIERDFGPEAFGRFWRSDADVKTAFQDAFGVSLGEWALGWVQRNFGVRTRGPGLSKSAGLGGLLTLSLFAVLAGAWARRRKVA